MKSVALVVPVFNVESYLRECLESITAQTYKNFVAYAINDGSTDNSGKILDEFSRIDNRIRVIHQKNGGVSCARNTALDAIERDGSFDYVGFVDSDDILLPSFIETCIKHMRITNSQYSVCGRANFDKKGIKKKSVHLALTTITRDGIYEHYFRKRSCGHNFEDPTVGFSLFNRIFSTNVIKGIRFDHALRAAEDIKYLLTVFPNIETGIIIPDILYLRRMRYSSITNSIDVLNFDWIVGKHFLSQPNTLSFKARLGLERFLINTWWSCVAKTYQCNPNKTNLEQIKEMHSELAYIIKIRNYNFHKKNILFSLGNTFLQFYFNYLRPKKNNHTDSFYK